MIILKNLIKKNIFFFLSISFLLHSYHGMNDSLIPLREKINLKIILYLKDKRKICEYKIDKSNNLIYLDNESNVVKEVDIDNEIYFYNYLFYANLEDDIYKFWLNKEVDLSGDGLYVDGEKIFQVNDIEKIYLVEYSTLEKKIKVPLVIKSDYLIEDVKDKEKLKVLSRDKKLKDINYNVLYNFVNYINKIEKCY